MLSMKKAEESQNPIVFGETNQKGKRTSAAARKLYLPKADRSHWQKKSSNDPLNLLYLGWGHREFGEEPIPSSRHTGWVYMVIEKGSPLLVTKNKNIRIPSGTAVIIGPDFESGWKDLMGSKSRVLVWVWQEPHLDQLLSEKSDAYHQIRLNPFALKRIQLFHQICREEVRQADRYSAAMLNGLQPAIESVLLRQVSHQAHRYPDSVRFEMALRWMESNLSTNEPASRLCDYLGVSLSSLHRLFKRAVSQNPSDCFHQLKMEKAKKSVLEEKKSVKETAYLLGYKHPNDLSRAFKTHYGYSLFPQKRRKK